MKEIANLSGGSFFTASSLEELRQVYDTLEEQIGFETTRGDASRPWLVLGVVFATAGLTIAWYAGSVCLIESSSELSKYRWYAARRELIG